MPLTTNSLTHQLGLLLEMDEISHLDYFSKNVPPIKLSGEKSKVLTLMLPLISCPRRNPSIAETKAQPLAWS
jgi:hypothetical protein